jgi:hypothetical protein
MRCFHHAEREADGTCKSCGKGVCSECAVDLDRGLACRGRCEANARAIIDLVERNIQNSGVTARLIQQNGSVRSGAGIFHIAMGILFLVWGLSDTRLALLLVMGAGFIAYGIYWLLLARKLKKERQKSQAPGA